MRIKPLFYSVVASVVLFTSGLGYGVYLGHSWWYAPSAGSVTTCFVPGEDCTQFVVDAINSAESEILVQAYNYTSPPILEALAKAKTEKKLDVRVILDKSNEQPRYQGGTFTQNHGIQVLTDYLVAIAHNKVIIIDKLHVLTGSFNFTRSAQLRNAENVILLKYAPEVAKRYIDNWNRRAKVSRPFALERSQ